MWCWNITRIQFIGIGGGSICASVMGPFENRYVYDPKVTDVSKTFFETMERERKKAPAYEDQLIFWKQQLNCEHFICEHLKRCYEANRVGDDVVYLPTEFLSTTLKAATDLLREKKLEDYFFKFSYDEKVKTMEAKKEADERKIMLPELFEWTTISNDRFCEIKRVAGKEHSWDLKTKPVILKRSERIYVWLKYVAVHQNLIQQITWTSRYFYFNEDGYLQAVTCKDEYKTLDKLCKLVVEETNQWNEEKLRRLGSAMKKTSDRDYMFKELGNVVEDNKQHEAKLLKMYTDEGFEEWTAEKQQE